MLVTPMQNLNIQDNEEESRRPKKHHLQLPSLQTVLETPYVNNDNNNRRPRSYYSRNKFQPTLSNLKTMHTSKQNMLQYSGNTFPHSNNTTMMETESISTDCRCPRDSSQDTNINQRVAMRKGLKLNCPPNITIYTPDGSEATTVKSDELDNEEFQSTVTQHSPITSPSFEKHEVHSGRLILVRHNGSGLNSPDSPSSPITPTRPLMSAFPFRSQSPLAVSPGSKSRDFSGSPTPKSPVKTKRNKVVFVRVYRCYNDHFATISRDCLYTAKSVYVNIRRCKLIPGNTLGRFILAGKMDSGDLIEFEAMEISALNQWLDAFQTATPPPSPGQCMSGMRSPIIPGSPHMPALAETDEENQNW